MICEEENLEKAYEGDEFMEKVIDIAKSIAGKKKIPLYLSESEIRRLDREEAVNEGIKQKETEMILNMNAKNIDIKTISEVCKLSIEEIQNIIKDSKEQNN